MGLFGLVALTLSQQRSQNEAQVRGGGTSAEQFMNGKSAFTADCVDATLTTGQPVRFCDQSDGTYSVTAGTSLSSITGDMRFPATWNGKAVTTVVQQAFGNTNGESSGAQMTSILIEEGYKTIATWAFYNCDKVVDMWLPQSLTTIGTKPFRGMKSLLAISIPPNVHEVIGWFDSCIALTTISFEGDITSVTSWSFSATRSLEYVYYCGSRVPTLGGGGTDGAFDNDVTVSVVVTSAYPANTQWMGRTVQLGATITNNAKFSFSDGLLTIQADSPVTLTENMMKGVCAGCVHDVVIENSIQILEQYAFRPTAGKLKSVSITSSSLTEIRQWSFYNCMSLNQINIPETVTVIGGKVFRGCGLTEIALPKSINNIAGGLFEKCYYLRTVNFTASTLNAFPGYVFSDCKSLAEIFYCGASNPGGTSTTFAGASDDFKVYVPAEYEGNDFAGKSGCVVHLGDEIRFDPFVEDGVRYSFNGIRLNVSVDPSAAPSSSAVVKTIGLVRATTQTALCATCSGNGCQTDNIKEVVISSGITEIDGSCFGYMSGITSVSLPEQLTRIGDSAFASCSGLTGNLTLIGSGISIGSWAFSGCGFSGVDIQSEVTSLGEYAFALCPGLMTVKISKISTSTTVPSGLFNQCGSLSELRYCWTQAPGYNPSSSPGPFEGCLSLTILVPLVYEGDFAGHSVEKRLGANCEMASERFTQSSQFQQSIPFTQSREMTQSHQFTQSLEMTLSRPFTQSSHMTQSLRFTFSNTMTDSSLFKATSAFSESFSFTEPSLSDSASLTDSQTLTLTLTLSESQSKIQSQSQSQSETQSESKSESERVQDSSFSSSAFIVRTRTETEESKNLEQTTQSQSQVQERTSQMGTTHVAEPSSIVETASHSTELAPSDTETDAGGSISDVSSRVTVSTGMHGHSSSVCEDASSVRTSQPHHVASTSESSPDTTGFDHDGSSSQVVEQGGTSIAKPHAATTTTTTALTAESKVEITGEHSSATNRDSGSSGEGGGSKVGMIVGIVIGVLVLIAIVVVLVWFFVIKKRKDSALSSEGSEMAIEASRETIDDTASGDSIDIVAVQGPLFEGDNVNDSNDSFSDQYMEESAPDLFA